MCLLAMIGFDTAENGPPEGRKNYNLFPPKGTNGSKINLEPPKEVRV